MKSLRRIKHNDKRVSSSGILFQDLDSFPILVMITRWPPILSARITTRIYTFALPVCSPQSVFFAIECDMHVHCFVRSCAIISFSGLSEHARYSCFQGHSWSDATSHVSQICENEQTSMSNSRAKMHANNTSNIKYVSNVRS